MENILMQYMSERSNRENEGVRGPLPVITISRDYGCFASRVAELLALRLKALSEEKGQRHPWKVVSKEILEKAASEMETRPEKISHVFGADEKGILADIVVSFSKQYNSDAKIKKTITSVVRAYAENGYSIIVGRAGCVIAHDMPRSLHIRLMAPNEWRVNRIADRFNISNTEARELVRENDEKRSTFMGYFRGNRPDGEIFDAEFNRATLSEEEIVEALVKIIILRNDW